MKRRSPIFRMIVLLLGIPLLFGGCAPEFSQNTQGNSSTLEAMAPTVTPSASHFPVQSETPAEPVTVEGEITAVRRSSFTLLLEDGTQLTVIPSREHMEDDELLQGNRAQVIYRPQERQENQVKALQVTVTVPEAYAQVEKLLDTMTLEEKVGQLFFVRYPGKKAPEEEARYQFGGYILFGRDFQELTKGEVAAQVEACQKEAKIPMLMGVDEEGGTVVRVSLNPNLRETPFPSPRELFKQGGLTMVTETEAEKCQLLKELGINVNFAPVCDVSQKEDAFMYSRSLGQNAQVTGDFVRETVGVYREENVGCVLKHFPGYGENGDTHTGVVVDRRSYADFLEEDFLPFREGIRAGAGCVLVSHNVVTCVDDEKPASLSGEWHRVLREELGFAGCVITDDLVMGAIQDYCDASSAAVQAVLAGNDLLCCSDYSTQYPAVWEAVQKGEISEDRVEQSVRRVLRWKVALGLL